MSSVPYSSLYPLHSPATISHEFYRILGRHPGVPDLVLTAVTFTGANHHTRSLAQSLPIKTRAQKTKVLLCTPNPSYPDYQQ